jgi:hypothetical protein
MMEQEALRAYQSDNMRATATAIDLAAAIKQTFAGSWIVENERRAVTLAAFYGCSYIRAFADVDSKARLEGVKALIRVREEFRGIVDIQVVAFAQDGIVREPGASPLMRKAMLLGADVVGGIPWIEHSSADAAVHIQTRDAPKRKRGNQEERDKREIVATPHHFQQPPTTYSDGSFAKFCKCFYQIATGLEVGPAGLIL